MVQQVEPHGALQILLNDFVLFRELERQPAASKFICLGVLLAKNFQRKAVKTACLYLEPNIQWVPQFFEQLEFFHVNESCKIECCGKKMHQIVQNMILT